MKYLLFAVFIFFNLALSGQTKYFVTAPAGLICRENPNAESARTGKIPYGSIVEIITKTNEEFSIVDGIDTIKGHWVKIQYVNFPYLISNQENFDFEEQCYVFDGFLEPLFKARIELTAVEPENYDVFMEDTDLEETEYDNTDFEEAIPDSSSYVIRNPSKAKSFLKDKVKFIGEEDSMTLDSVFLDSGQTLGINQESNDLYFIAYYPKEDVLFFEGGHMSEFSISLKTGESVETVGNPEYIVNSPNNKVRLNAYHSGQECIFYFFQEIKEDKNIYLIDFGWASENGPGQDVCYFREFYWLDDESFVFSYVSYNENPEGNWIYYKGEIVKLNSN